MQNLTCNIKLTFIIFKKKKKYTLVFLLHFVLIYKCYVTQNRWLDFKLNYK